MLAETLDDQLGVLGRAVAVADSRQRSPRDGGIHLHLNVCNLPAEARGPEGRCAMVAEHKAELRKTLRATRDALSDALRAERSREAWLRLLSSDCPIREATTVGLYAAIGSELATAGLFELLRNDGRRLCYPRTERKLGVLHFVHTTSLTSLAPGTFGVLEPQGEALPLAEIEAIIVPGLGFDVCGSRLGYGGGFYDRTLSTYAGCAVGLAFDCQLVEKLPRHAHDRNMDWVFTERRSIAGGELCLA